MIIPCDYTSVLDAHCTKDDCLALKWTRVMVTTVPIRICEHAQACFHAIATLAFVTAIAGGHMSAESRVQLAKYVSKAAGMGPRGEGEVDQGPAMCETAHGQQYARASDECDSAGAPMKNDAKPHR